MTTEDQIGNRTPSKVVGTVRAEIPAGTKVYVGGFPIALRSDVGYDADPVYAPFIKAAIEKQHER